jgi:hypothetical protein
VISRSCNLWPDYTKRDEPIETNARSMAWLAQIYGGSGIARPPPRVRWTEFVTLHAI